MPKQPWTPEEVQLLDELDLQGASRKEMMARLRRGYDSISGKLKQVRAERNVKQRVSPSVYPRYDEPLAYEGDAVVIPDPEFPFQHAPFINQVLDLADAWSIPHLVVAGDMLHFASLSRFDPAWTGDNLELAGSNLAIEMRLARKQIKQMVKQFDSVDLVLGNHEGRILRTLGSVIGPQDLMRMLSLDGPKWRSAPYYYSTVNSNGEPYRIEHPRTTAKYSAGALADKYQTHVIMAHSHRVYMTPSRSGEWQGWQIGTCVDEKRLPYAAQRSNAGDAHRLGAAIVRNGSVYVLSDGWTDWEFLKSWQT